MTGSFIVPETQKGIIYQEVDGPLIYGDLLVPEPKPNEILVNVKYSGVCHSDLHIWKGDWPASPKLPLVGGHEGAGIVVAKGSLVNNFEVGDYAGIKWLNGSCLGCEYCQLGYEINCAKGDISGVTHDGTFQQYATADALQAAHIPKGTDLAKVAPILCAGVTVYRALKTADLRPGQWVAIPGAGGGLGTCAIQYAKAMGLRVLAIDGGDEKKKLCTELGAEVYVDFLEEKNVIKKVIESTGGGPHGVLNVSVSELAITQSVSYIRPLGKIVLVGMPPNAVLRVPVFDQVVKSFEIKGTSVGNRLDTREAIDFFTRGLIKMPINIVPLSQISTVFDLMIKGKINGRYVVDTSG